MHEFVYSIFQTEHGFLGLVASKIGLQRLILFADNEDACKKEIARHYTGEMLRNEDYFGRLKERILKYLKAEKVVFVEKLDVRGATPFEMRVWEVVQSIPFGEVRTYDWVAKAVKDPLAWQAVGGALSRNRVPIVVPCHRVIKKDGDLGGFAGGPEIKRLLLKIEGRVW